MVQGADNTGTVMSDWLDKSETLVEQHNTVDKLEQSKVYSVYKAVFSHNCCVYFCSGNVVSGKVVNSINFCLCVSSGKAVFISGKISFYLNFCLYFCVIIIKNKYCKQI